MTDNEIIKGLECCRGVGCKSCPFNVNNAICISYLIEDVLDLINRQKGEIERLKKYNTDVAFKHYNDGKAEAIKEFAERLKQELQEKKYKYVTDTNYSKTCNAVIDSCVVCIDNLVKEMVGEQRKEDERK